MSQVTCSSNWYERIKYNHEVTWAIWYTNHSTHMPPNKIFQSAVLRQWLRCW